jgi:uncharacterized protein (UPF0332 family)
MNTEKSELVNLRIVEAKKTFNEVELFHIPNQLWNTAINRLYYACFYAVIALLHNHDIETKTHGGTKRMFELHFVKKGIVNQTFSELYASLFRMRQEADYEAGVDVLPLVPQAAAFIDRIVVVLSEA